MLRRLIMFCWLLSLIPVPFVHAQESDEPVRQAFENVVLMVNESQITMLISVGVTRPTSEPLTWLIPLPAEPLRVKVAAADALMRFELTILPYPEILSQPCQLSKRSTLAGGDIRFSLPRIAGAEMQDYGIFSGVSEQEVSEAIRAAGFTVDDWMSETMQAYPPNTPFFVLRAAWPEYVDSGPDIEYRLPMVMVRYEADSVHLLEQSAGLSSPVTVWILGDGQYVPAGSTELLWADWPAIQASNHQVRDMGHLVLRQLLSDHPIFDYERVRSLTLSNAGTGAWLTEYAYDLHPQVVQMLFDWTPAYYEPPFITRLRAEPQAGEPNPAVTFVPAPDFPNVPYFIELEDWGVDSLEYWGCSSETALNPALSAALPDAHTRIDVLRMDVAHPDGWVLSEVAWQDDLMLYVIAPEPVSADMIAAYFAGERDLSFFLAFEADGPPDEALAREWIDEYWYLDADQDLFTQHFGTVEQSPVWLRYWPYGGDSCALERAVVYGAFIDDDPALARAMRNYAASYQYFASAFLPYTLFLNDDIRGEQPILMVPYPPGWTPRLNRDGSVEIAPEDHSARVLLEPTGNPAPDNWRISVQGDRSRWDRAMSLIREGITTESGCGGE